MTKKEEVKPLDRKENLLRPGAKVRAGNNDNGDSQGGDAKGTTLGGGTMKSPRSNPPEPQS